MGWTTTHDLDAFTAAAGPFLRAEPAAHTVLLTAAASLAAAGLDRYGDAPPEFGWWRGADGRVAGAFLGTPPLPLLLAHMPPSAAAGLAELRAAGGLPVTGINAGRAAAEAFAGAWTARTGAAGTVEERHRLYRLGELVPPDPAPPGRARPATADDRDLLVDWTREFHVESGGGVGDPARAVADRLAYGGATLWEDGGRPVSYAGITRTVAGMARVAPVYTPPPLRRRGYAAAVTAAVSRAAAAVGAREVLLFTDLANATSNALYQRLGYVPVEDHLVISFDG
ncbi:GNAT family N-acetyltransferase [Streptomyces sp. WMMC500]|uniref:GNAT family N-acetyltransferase n=1 Tax=Streptomyces sp. WMMC500 TaxID=3015154 RepID=UPI00248C7164|nr:GNAT family N-acetyltransferase [Streptomyces sp. WMMC500]WBB61342.1 GNAT family N-acetyltransferase [Streptomyces sp. WMMC500]